ncbi:MAG TPA: methyltransferase domain-containing protein, partial [Bradyrhizobium sp.]
MDDATQLHADQIAYWNGPGGAQWAAQQRQTDAMLAPVAEATIEHAAPKAGELALDIGCGCGSATLMLAREVGAAGHVTGLDVSAPMLDVAKERARRVANVDWVAADAAAF